MLMGRTVAHSAVHTAISSLRTKAVFVIMCITFTASAQRLLQKAGRQRILSNQPVEQLFILCSVKHTKWMKTLEMCLVEVEWIIRWTDFIALVQISTCSSCLLIA
jgi:hypothetical protein